MNESSEAENYEVVQNNNSSSIEDVGVNNNDSDNDDDNNDDDNDDDDNDDDDNDNDNDDEDNDTSRIFCCCHITFWLRWESKASRDNADRRFLLNFVRLAVSEGNKNFLLHLKCPSLMREVTYSNW